MTIRMTFLKRMMNALIDARERAVQRRIRLHLRSLSDRHLADIGISRQLLERGPKAWPWRTPLEPYGTPMLAAAMQGRNSSGHGRPADQDRGEAGQADRFDHTDSDDKLAA